MKKVIQFKKVLIGVDTVVNLAIAILFLIGFAAFAKLGVGAGLPLIIFGCFFWLIKVLGFGISYTLIQIAENTAPESFAESAASSVKAGSLEEKFLELYEEYKDTSFVTDSMHRTYKLIQENEKVSRIVLDNAIEKLKTIKTGAV